MVIVKLEVEKLNLSRVSVLHNSQSIRRPIKCIFNAQEMNKT